MNLKTQSGRSMVEMLGTLAIIGVLSIGGIAGYSKGMDKYRANETMRNISLRTVDLIAQANHAADLSFAEWKNEDSIYDFSNPTFVEGENLIAFDVGATKKLPQSVCQMVFDGLSNIAAQIDINESVATSKDSCDKDNTMTFYFASGGNTSVDNNTGGGTTGEQCGDTVCGTCQKCDAATETCETVDDYEQKCTTDDNKTGWCVSGSCQPDTTCNCSKGQYCTDTNESAEHATPSGTCVAANPQFSEVKIDGTSYYISRDTMSWWDAVSACEALGNKKLLRFTDLACDSNDRLGYGSDTDSSGYASDLSGYGSDILGYGSHNNAYTLLGAKLYIQLGNTSVWTNEMKNPFDGNTKNYCNGIVFSTGFYLANYDPSLCNSDSYHYALCR